MALGCSVTLLAKRSQTARETIYRIEAGEKVRRAVIDRVVAAIKDPGMPAACAEMKRRQLSGITGERHVFTKEQFSLGAKRGGRATSANKAHMRAIGARGGSVKRGSVRANNFLANREWMVAGLPTAAALAAHSGRWIIRDGEESLSLQTAADVDSMRSVLSVQRQKELSHWPIDGYGNKVKYPRDGSRRL